MLNPHTYPLVLSDEEWEICNQAMIAWRDHDSDDEVFVASCNAMRETINRKRYREEEFTAEEIGHLRMCVNSIVDSFPPVPALTAAYHNIDPRHERAYRRERQ